MGDPGRDNEFGWGIVDAEAAAVLHKTTFIEAVVAPSYDEGVLKKAPMLLVCFLILQADQYIY